MPLLRSIARAAISGSRLPVGLLAAVLLLLAGLAPSLARAQGSVQVLVTGVPPVLGTASVDELARAYQQGRFPIQVVYNNPSGRAAPLRFRLQLEHDGAPVLDWLSEPTLFQPGIYRLHTFAGPPRVVFPGDYAALMERLPSGLRDQISRTGRLPEGDYVYTIEAEPADGAPPMPSVPGTAAFSVRLGEPPVLLAPADASVVEVAMPVFSWAPPQQVPVGLVVAYDLRIVEVLAGQSPYEALQANIPHVTTTVTGQTTFAYTPSELPLESGKRYAWQVTARDPLDRFAFTDAGRTEIQTFRRAEAARAIAWRYPRADPIMEFEILDAEPVPTGLLVDGTYEGLVDGQPMSATFDGVVLHPTLFSILEGTVTLGDGRPLEDVID